MRDPSRADHWPRLAGLSQWAQEPTTVPRGKSGPNHGCYPAPGPAQGTLLPADAGIPIR